MEELVKKLYKVEGGIFHYNEGEKDITSPAGVYKYAHPNIELWKFVNEVCVDFGIPTNTKNWTKYELDSLNDLLDIEEISSKIFELEVNFYLEENKHLRIHLFHNELKYLVFNLYTNSHVGLWRSVQYGIRKLINNGELTYPIKNTSIVDGKFGRKTENALKVIKNLNIDKQIKFKKYILDGMEDYYIYLAKKPQYKKYINGWLNRIDNLRNV